MTPRVAEPLALTEAQTLEQAQLDAKYQAGKLTDRDRQRRLELKAGGASSRPSTLGGRIVTGREFKRLAAKALGTNGNLALEQDVPLAALGGGETKTLLRAGSATSVGASQSPDASGEYAPARRPLDLLDLVRAGSTDDGSVAYMRQTTYTQAAVEVAEATSTTSGAMWHAPPQEAWVEIIAGDRFDLTATWHAGGWRGSEVVLLLRRAARRHRAPLPDPFRARLPPSVHAPGRSPLPSPV
jgi:hypothetical protein